MSADRSSHIQKPTILIVDDDPVQRTLVSQAVEHAGMTPAEAENGAEGLAKVKELRPDLVILDVIMPDVNGFSVCKQIREIPQTTHLPVLMMTGLDDTESVERAFEVGATAFLTKPLHTGLLSYHLKYMLRAARMEIDIRRSMRAAQEASIAKSQFLANMGHELRTPLNAILGFSEIMMDEHLGPLGAPRYRSYAEDIHGSAERLLTVINEILDIAKVETGKIEVDLAPVDLCQTIDAVTRCLAQRATDHSIMVTTDVEAGLTAMQCDERRLRQILLNLLGNAIKFTPPGGSVSLRATRENERDVVIVITDTGIGIAPSQIDTALSLFGQVDGGLSRKYEGAGLGLLLAKLIMECLGGSLTLDSGVGAGTTVTLRFPHAALDAERQAEPAPRAETA